MNNNISKLIIICYLSLQCLASCQKEVTDFGNNCTISGTLKDQFGNNVAGDITTTNLSVKALGEGDIVTTDMRVNGNGDFQNTKLFPKKYSIWVTGPITMSDDTIRVDLSKNRSFTQDIKVIPFLTITKPSVIGNPTGSTVNISYQITANSGKTVSKRALYCSTNPYPNASTGSGAFYTTQNITLSDDSGNITVDGLVSNTTYYIRIGAQATGASGFNYSEQIEITTL